MIFINNRIVVNPSKLYLEQFINGCINNELELEEKLVSIDDDTIKNNKIFLEYYSKSEVSKTITSHMKLDCNMYIHPLQSRGLSPREAARIQSFPDDYIFMGSNNTWYAQIGNAVPVLLAEIIGKSIKQYLN